nr:retrotransposon protein, putative, Ty1-copia subclass [Tanacetum cinerariifolium]
MWDSASKERLDVVKSLIACKPKLRAFIFAFILKMKGYFDILESLNMVFDAELSIKIILSFSADYNQFVLSYQMNRKETSIVKLHSLLQTSEQGIKKPTTSSAPVLTVGHNAKKRKTSHSNWKGKAAKGKSDRGSKRKDLKDGKVKNGSHSVNIDTQQEVVTHVKPDDISLQIHKTSGRVSKPSQFYYGFHIEEDKISNSTISKLNERAYYKEAMASLEAAKWKEAIKSKIHEDESYIYVKVSGIVVVFLVLYVDDIILIGNDIPMLQSVKDWLGKCFAMNDLRDAAYILGIKIYIDRSKRLIGHSQDTYLDKILKRIQVENSKKGNIPLHHGIKISKDLCMKTDEELDRMSRVPYASDVGSIMYAMTCTRPDVSFALSMASRQQYS